MINIGKTQVCITKPIEIGLQLLNAEAIPPCDIAEFTHSVSIFHIWASTFNNMFKLYVRPIVEDPNDHGIHIYTHSADFLMSYDEISEVYKDPAKFINDIYERDNNVFDQDPIRMSVVEHNACVIRSKNSKIELINSYNNIDESKVGIGLVGYDTSTGEILTGKCR